MKIIPVLLVYLYTDPSIRHEEEEEFYALAYSVGANPQHLITGRLRSPQAKFFIGLGKLNEIKTYLIEHKIELIIFNHELSPSQERNLEKELKVRLLDRTGLILDIFARRAKTAEGKLQVELAQLDYLSTRLVRGWTHLERQKGGIGLRGPGETQLEVDKRLIRNRIKLIRLKLEAIRRHRSQHRRLRQRQSALTVSLVGYTNSGKSTLFNTLTKAQVYAADQLFATLDPTLRKIYLPEVGNVILADTVGFIQRLPHLLIEAFRSTLEEIKAVDLLIHVVDFSNPAYLDQIKAVDQVLTEIGAIAPRLLVFNKMDLKNMPVRVDILPNRMTPYAVYVSAKEKQGIDLLQKTLSKMLLS